MVKLCYFLKNNLVIGLLLFCGIVFSIGIAQLHLFDLDELYFAEITREMMVTGKYRQVQFNFEPLYEKPPLFFWIQALSMWLWGVNEWGARFPNILCGVLTLASLYHIGKKYKGKRFGILWACLYVTSFLPHFYFKSALIDPFFNYFSFLSIYFLSAARGSTTQSSLLAGLFMGMAMLTKGPIGVFVPFCTILLHMLSEMAKTQLSGCLLALWRLLAISRKLLGATAIAIFIGACWLIPEIASNGLVFIKEFWHYHLLLYQSPVDTHTHGWYYHLLVLFWGCFPSSFFGLLGFKQKKLAQKDELLTHMQCLFMVVLLTFTLVGTKIVHYSSMAYFPITFFAAHFFDLPIATHRPIPRWIPFLFLAFGMVIALGLLLMPWMMLHKERWICWVNNPNVRFALDLPVLWSYWDSMPGVVYAIGLGVSFYYLLRCRLVLFIGLSMVVHMGSLTLFLSHIGPKIEAYVQKELVDFCKACSGQEVYLVTVGFKAAAPLFYANKPLEKGLKEQDLPWLLAGAIDKPCFYIIYKSDKEQMKPYPTITHLKDSGCFSFYQRLPATDNEGLLYRGYCKAL
ncbi:MAG: glycosyltransferase family 39 protein [Amoebophilaceae bacterium]|nr:glycosyltransferase family 39 protein [Amoebophilaceae bacterium]